MPDFETFDTVESELAELPPADAAAEFDPEIHQTDKDGEPKRNKDGSLRKKRRKAESVPEVSPYASLATMSAQSVIALSVLAGGEDFAPVKQKGIDEFANLSVAFEAWYEAHEIDDLPPNLALAFALGGYWLPRFAKPEPRNRFGKAWDWVAKKVRRKG